jgi:hypothetical protein
MSCRAFALLCVLTLLTSTAGMASGQELWVSHPLQNLISIHDAAGTVLETVAMKARPGSMAISPDGATIVVTEYAGSRLDVLDAASRTSTMVFHLTVANLGGGDVTFSPDGAFLWYLGLRGVEIYSVPDYQLIRYIKLDVSPEAQLAVGNDGIYLPESYSGRYWVWPFDGSGPGVARGRRALPGGIAVVGETLLLSDATAGGITVIPPEEDQASSLLALGDLDYPGARLVVNPDASRVVNLHGSHWPSVVDLATGAVTTVKMKRCPPRNGAFVSHNVLAVTCLNRFISLVNITQGTKHLISIPLGDSWDVVVRR